MGTTKLRERIRRDLLPLFEGGPARLGFGIRLRGAGNVAAINEQASKPRAEESCIDCKYWTWGDCSHWFCGGCTVNLQNDGCDYFERVAEATIEPPGG